MSGGRQSGWELAREALGVLAHERGARDLRAAIGRLRFLGAGIWSAVYSATITLPDGREERLVVKLPEREAGPERDELIAREAAVLRVLEPLELPFRVPRAITELPAVGGLVAIQSWLPGMPLDLRAERAAGERPWDIVARVAATVHALEAEPFRRALAGRATRREHALDHARILDGLSGPEGEEARAWVHAHLPPPEPSTLLHGDLLGQNILVPLDGEPLGVIDWAEATLGDPAYDLANVTRGARRPFGREDGLARLLEAYGRLAPRPLSEAAVRLHEVLLRAGLYLDTVEELGPGSERAADERRGLRSMLARAAHHDP